MSSLLTRHIEPAARDILAYMPGLLIEGARQVGKSTLTRQLVAGDDALVLSLDDQSTRDAVREDPSGLLAHAGGRVVVIDEIQRLPELTLAVKASIDGDKRPGRYILTGSSSLFRVRGLADSLAGRVGRLTLYGFSQGELAGRTDDFAGSVSQTGWTTGPEFTTTVSRSQYAELIAAGTYPDAVSLTDARRRGWLDDYLQGLIRRDLPGLHREVRPDRVLALIRLLAANQAGELVKAHLARDAQIPAATITTYLDLLADTWLAAALPPWTPNLSQREIARPKALVLDSGLATRLNRLTGARLATLEYGQAFGSLLEGFVSAELLRQQAWTTAPYDLYHYRDRAGAEVDLILELEGGQVIAIEVKASTSFQASHFQGLKQLRDRLGERFLLGIVLNTGPTGYRYADRLYGLPVSAVWEL